MVMALSTLIILVGVPTASVIYSVAKVITVNFQGQVLFGLDLGSITVGCWIIGCLAAVFLAAAVTLLLGALMAERRTRLRRAGAEAGGVG